MAVAVAVHSNAKDRRAYSDELNVRWQSSFVAYVLVLIHLVCAAQAVNPFERVEGYEDFPDVCVHYLCCRTDLPKKKKTTADPRLRAAMMVSCTQTDASLSEVQR